MTATSCTFAYGGHGCVFGRGHQVRYHHLCDGSNVIDPYAPDGFEVPPDMPGVGPPCDHPFMPAPGSGNCFHCRWDGLCNGGCCIP